MRTYRFGSKTAWLDKDQHSYPTINQAWGHQLGLEATRILYVYEDAIVSYGTTSDGHVVCWCHKDGTLVGSLDTLEYITNTDFIKSLNLALAERGLQEETNLTTLIE